MRRIYNWEKPLLAQVKACQIYHHLAQEKGGYYRKSTANLRCATAE